MDKISLKLKGVNLKKKDITMFGYLGLNYLNFPAKRIE